MQAVLLTAGASSRMYPFARDDHKSMIKLLGKPILEHVIEKLKNKKITDLIIVVGKESNVKSYFGDGNKFGVSIKYVVQEKPEGAGNALFLAKEYINDSFLLLNSYHVEVGKFIENLSETYKISNDGVLLVKKRNDVSSYGVVKIKEEKVVEIIEKPSKGSEPSNLCIIGIYLLSSKFLNTLEETPPEHYQLESALDKYVKTSNVGYVKTEEESIVLKYPWDLLAIKDYLLGEIKSHKGERVKVAENVVISGDVYISDDVTILEGSCIKGPCYLGKGSYLGSNSLLRSGVDLGENVVVGAYCEVKNSIIMESTKTHSGYVGDSIIGKHVKIGGRFTTTNARLDRKNISVNVKGEKVDTGYNHFGVIIGNNSQIGANVTTMPGLIVGYNSAIGPSTTVINDVSENTTYFTKFKEIIEKK